MMHFEGIFSTGRRSILILCAFLHGLNHALQLILPPLYVAIRDDLGLEGLSRVMLLGTVYFVVYALVGFPYGVLADRFSKKKILLAGTFLNSFAFVIVAYSRSYSVLLAAMVLGGIGGGTYHPVGNALLSNLFKDTVGRAFGIAGIGSSLGLFVGPIASGFMGMHYGWRVSCLAFAILGMGFAAALVLLMPEEDGKALSQKGEGSAGRTLLAALAPVIIVFGLRDFCFWGVTYLTPTMTQARIGFTEGTAGLVIGLMSLTGAFSQPLAGAISDRFGRQKVLGCALALAGICVLFLPHAGRISIFLLALTSGITLLATVPVIDAAAAEIVPPFMRGRLFGGMMTLGILLGALSPYIVGMIHDAAGGYSAAYLALGLSALLGSALSLFVFSRGS